MAESNVDVAHHGVAMSALAETLAESGTALGQRAARTPAVSLDDGSRALPRAQEALLSQPAARP